MTCSTVGMSATILLNHSLYTVVRLACTEAASLSPVTCDSVKPTWKSRPRRDLPVKPLRNDTASVTLSGSTRSFRPPAASTTRLLKGPSSTDTSCAWTSFKHVATDERLYRGLVVRVNCV